MMDLNKIQHATVDTSKEPIEFGDGRVASNLADLKLDVEKNKIVMSLSNMVTILDGLSCWSGVFAFDELAEQILVLRPLPGSRGNPNLHKPRPLRDDDASKVRMWLNSRLKQATVNKNDVFDAIQLVARERIISPIRHYLEGLPPMAVGEAQNFLKDVLNSHFNLRRYGEHPDALLYSELVFRKWLISAVARALQPACKADHVLILEGAQGAGKSTAIRILCGNAYFGDSVPRLDSKDAADYVRAKWIIELAELSSVSKTEIEHVKAYITRTEEKFRPAYGRNEVTYQRRCVFIGTTNRTDYLRDETGNRRFWPIKLDTVDLAAIERDRDQIWAAAKALYEAGEQWWLTDPEALLAQAQQERRTAVDPLYDEVAEWLSSKGKKQTCMREVMQQVAFVDEAISAAAMTPLLQHRIRGALNAAGFESLGRRFSAGDYKGMTIFALVEQQV
jgi:predicted P-loop ATPase